MIKMLLIGHLGKDAEVNNVNGKSVINFNVAHSENYTDRNGAKTTKTTWVQCAYWTDKTGIVPYLKKGGQVFVEGQPEVNTWQDNQGKTQATQKLRVSSIQLLGAKKEGEAGVSSPASTATTYGGGNAQPSVTDTNGLPIDDLPF